MKQTIPQEEVRRSIISDMVQKRNSIVPVIGEDAMVYSLGVPFVLLWLSFGALAWIRSAFFAEPSGRSTSGRLFPKGLKKAEREKGSIVMRRDMPLMNIHSSTHEVGLVPPRTFIL